eukprot:15354127-Ditylum_brightwellii.AAC.1
MNTVPTTSKQSNPDVKRAVIPFPRPSTRQLKCGQFHAYKLRTTPADAASSIYELSVPFFEREIPEEWVKFQCGLSAVLKGQNVTQGPPSYAVAKTLLKGDALAVFEQAEIAHGNQTVPHFDLYLDDMAEHGQYRERMGSPSTRVKQISQEFSAHNGNPTQPLDADELLDILEIGVLLSWHREFTVQGFDPVDQGLRKFVAFCTCLESCEPSKVEPKGEKPSKMKTAEKHKAKVSTTPTASLADKTAYKDLNAFVNAKVTKVLRKAKKEQKEKKAKKVTINAFDKFCYLNVNSSSKEESDHKVNALAAGRDNDSDSDGSCVPSEDSNSNDK